MVSSVVRLRMTDNQLLTAILSELRLIKAKLPNAPIREAQFCEVDGCGLILGDLVFSINGKKRCRECFVLAAGIPMVSVLG